MSSKKGDKFAVGDTAWHLEDRYRRTWVEYRVIERTKTGYVVQRPGVAWRSSVAGDQFYKPEKVSTVKMNRWAWMTAQGKEDWAWAEEHRSKIVREITYGHEVSPTTLRKIAELIGYKAEG